MQNDTFAQRAVSLMETARNSNALNKDERLVFVGMALVNAILALAKTVESK